MADENKSRAEQNARRVARWLAENEAEFSQGINEGRLAEAAGLAGEEITEAVDHLENREDVVRFPHLTGAERQTVLKPGRGWPELRDEVLGAASGG
jgi:hypothetical protein